VIPKALNFGTICSAATVSNEALKSKAITPTKLPLASQRSGTGPLGAEAVLAAGEPVDLPQVILEVALHVGLQLLAEKGQYRDGAI
jgi:hypothetical protein